MPRRLFTDDEEPVFLLNPSDNVYSYFMFIGPTESKRQTAETKGSWTWDNLIGYILVFLNFLLQGVLLYTIFHTVVMDNEEWQKGIYSVGGESWNLLAPKDDSKCNDGNSLCFSDNGMYSCAPPTIQLTGRWNELDVDGDGIWTREEVLAKKDELKCKYVVNPVEVFDVFISFLKARENLIWLHPDVKAGNAVHLPYFKYAMGDILMCGYRSKDMCANLVKAGFFHAPLKYGTAPRVGTEIDTALVYCHKLLAPGGTCDTVLPSTYSVWKIESEAQCGSPSYDKFTYTNPGNNITKSLLSVDYSARQEYELSQTLIFRLFKGVILMLWLIGMGLELREVVNILTLVMKYPDADQFGEDAVIEETDPADPEDVRYRILGIEKKHRMNIGALTTIRLFYNFMLTWIGAVFLMKQVDYIDLLLDGVALVYIVEIAGTLYSQILREEVRDQTEDIKPMRVEMYGFDYLNRRPALMDILVVLFILSLTIFLLEQQQKQIVIPVYEALQCTCIKTGEKCVEAQKFNFDFWYNYWKNTVPAVFAEVSQLKANPAAHSVNFAAAAAGYVSTATAYAAGGAQGLLNKAHHTLTQHQRSTRRMVPQQQHESKKSSLVHSPKYASEEEGHISEHQHRHHHHGMLN